MTVALLTAAGTGTRMGQDIPKQFMYVEDKPIIIHTMEVFQKHPAIDKILVVTLPSWIEVLSVYAKQYGITKLEWIVAGGTTGQESIKHGLDKLSEVCAPEDIVMIHDGNRCNISTEIITNSLVTCEQYGSAVAAIPCVEVVYYSEDGVSAKKSYPRENLYRTQTPHTYPLGKLLWAHSEAEKKNITNTAATCSLMTLLDEEIHLSKGSDENLKITTVDDLMIFKSLLHTKKDSWIK